MTRIRTWFRSIAPLVLAAFASVSLHIPAAQAGMIAPSTYTQHNVTTDPHQQLHDFLARDDIRAELVKLGVDPAAAQTRVDALTAEEAALAAERMPEMPAGGNVVGAIVFIFLVLLITDLLGLTDVFPFVRK